MILTGNMRDMILPGNKRYYQEIKEIREKTFSEET